ncbi:hypothetical protein QAD02_011089 [Eretmocerus hayati]|uniref:Uncharacterized protein n=1 Tax=Eretmocerus hayati TaxID=131215 RepID=A0ACC2NWR8_9HYME|nr:hypothetical protein QAD02_011089 [Eretmocerus hayati]
MVTHNEPMTFQDVLKSHLYLQTLVIIILLYVLLLIVLKYSLNTSWSSLAMEYVRVLVGAATVAHPEGSPRRLVFVFLISAMAIVTTSFQGYLSAMVTSPDNKPIVDSLADLIESKLIPSGSSSTKDTIPSKYWSNRYSVIEDHRECLRLMLNSTPIACIINEVHMPNTFYDNPRVHISINNFLERSLSFTFTDDSPLLNRMNHILSRMQEAGFFDLFWNKRRVRVDFNNGERISDGSFMYENQVMIIYSLCTAWSVSVIVFIIEIAYFNLKRSNPTVKTRPHQVIRTRRVLV